MTLLFYWFIFIFCFQNRLSHLFTSGDRMFSSPRTRSDNICHLFQKPWIFGEYNFSSCDSMGMIFIKDRQFHSSKGVIIAWGENLIVCFINEHEIYLVYVMYQAQKMSYFCWVWKLTYEWCQQRTYQALLYINNN